MREGVKKCLFLSTLRVWKLSTQGGGQKWQNSVHVVVECPPVERTILHLIQYPSLLPLNPWKVFFSADLNNCNTGNRHHCYKSRTKCLSLFSLHYVAKSYRKSPLFQFLWFLKIIFYQLLVYPEWMNWILEKRWLWNETIQCKSINMLGYILILLRL